MSANNVKPFPPQPTHLPKHGGVFQTWEPSLHMGTNQNEDDPQPVCLHASDQSWKSSKPGVECEVQLPLHVVDV